ncbi:M56 family metallopeptidase [Ekhidna sp.]|uniref:M56 family metallopeptidase n=1 Tax=Ekhidna sp. TaxID=2608089 RepID=UPI0032979C2B
MNQLVVFGIEFLLASSIFYLVYLIIKDHTTPTFKRFYLLSWMVFSVSLPLINIELDRLPNLSVTKIMSESSIQPKPKPDLKFNQNNESFEEGVKDSKTVILSNNESQTEVNWRLVFSICYLVISVFYLIRIIIGIVQIIRLRLVSSVLPDENSVFQVNSSSFKGASFFNWIFIGGSIETDRDVIIQHERVHAKLGHSVDILLSHIYRALFWMNPFSWVLKKLIGLNTELEVDIHMLREKDAINYANTLLSLSSNMKDSAIMNHFGAFHLRSRILALTKTVRHNHWVSILTFFSVVGLFFTISCENINSSEVMIERMNDVKSITTRFVSHQTDTQQKTGKIVAIASFSPDGTLEELVEQTSYPYDREFEVKKVFWEAPEKSGIPYVMDGLSLGTAEKSFLYGHDWPSAYYKHLSAKNQSIDLPWWQKTITVDSEVLPTEIQVKHEYDSNIVDFGTPNVTEYFEYENEKVVKVFLKTEYLQIDDANETIKELQELVNKNFTKEQKAILDERRANSGQKKLASQYIYEGDLLTIIKRGDSERRFYYENNLMIKSEYVKSGEVINTRIHYYKNSLKDRTEIFNRYNEPEYTITYEYEYW